MNDHPWNRHVGLSIVIPLHNSSMVLARTIERWLAYLSHGRTEIILVENGSTDLTWPLAQELAKDTPHVRFRLAQSEKGMGNALRVGIEMSTAPLVLLTADDLPFDFTDVDEARKLDPRPHIIIGSKAHPGSQINRHVHRHLYTYGYRVFRRALLGSEVGDSQGTIIADGDWLRENVSLFTEPGFLFTTQLIYAAELQGLSIAEVPVVLSKDHAPKPSTVRISDAWDMGVGLLRLRRARRALSVQQSPEVVA
ncbi:glycosyltransferase family 2 protein [Leifsonia sp. AG29]|uniref:glycosyltransferase family 2 protein n=1 Tax=Leifsonia sp. AG29 TaxID=2598860 RepID=UPI00131D445A|nr:glycosyltransferase family 2 protein [Leifsonia sp. AG29]